MRSWIYIVPLLFIVVSTYAIAKAPVKKLLTQAPPPTFSPSFAGLVESRPGYHFSSEKAVAYLYLEAGIKLTPTRFFGYQQRLQHALRDQPANKSNLMWDDGFIHFTESQAWKSQETPTTLIYEGRLYLPVNEIERAKGLQFAMRNYFTFKRDITPGFSMLFTEIPIVYAYAESGSGTGADMAANPIFENRIYLGPELTWLNGKVLWDNLLAFGMTRYRSFNPKAKRDDSWTGAAWIYSELDITLMPGVVFGLAYESGAFADFNFTDTGAKQNPTNFQGLGEAILRVSF